MGYLCWDTSAWHDQPSHKHDSDEWTCKKHQQWSSYICQSYSTPYKNGLWIYDGTVASSQGCVMVRSWNKDCDVKRKFEIAHG